MQDDINDNWYLVTNGTFYLQVIKVITDGGNINSMLQILWVGINQRCGECRGRFVITSTCNEAVLLRPAGPFVTGLVFKLLESMALVGISDNRCRPRDLNLIYICKVNAFTANDKLSYWNRCKISYTRYIKTTYGTFTLFSWNWLFEKTRQTPCLVTVKRSCRVERNIIGSCFHASAAFLAKVKQKRGHIQGTHKMLGGTSVVALRGAYKSKQPLSCRATHKNALGETENAGRRPTAELPAAQHL